MVDQAAIYVEVEGGGGLDSPNPTAPLKYIEYGVYGDLIIIYPKPYSIYLWGTIIL